MEQIIQAISAKLNLPESSVRSGIGIILKFLKEKSAGTEFEKFLALLPGAEAILAAAPAAGGEAGGVLGGILGKAGGLLGGDLGGAASALAALQGAGIPVDKAAPLAGEFFEQARSAVGPDVVAQILNEVPALKSFLGKA